MSINEQENLAQRQAAIEQEVKDWLEKNPNIRSFFNSFVSTVVEAWKYRDEKQRPQNWHKTQESIYGGRGSDHSDKYYSGTMGDFYTAILSLIEETGAEKDIERLVTLKRESEEASNAIMEELDSRRSQDNPMPIEEFEAKMMAIPNHEAEANRILETTVLEIYKKLRLMGYSRNDLWA